MRCGTIDETAKVSFATAMAAAGEMHIAITSQPAQPAGGLGQEASSAYGRAIASKLGAAGSGAPCLFLQFRRYRAVTDHLHRGPVQLATCWARQRRAVAHTGCDEPTSAICETRDRDGSALRILSGTTRQSGLGPNVLPALRWQQLLRNTVRSAVRLPGLGWSGYVVLILTLGGGLQ
jgi:hypothetical protein